MFVIVRGAGDLATGIALRLHRAHFRIVMTEIAQPTTIRRTVSFSEAVRCGNTEVEGVRAVLADSPAQALELAESGKLAVLVDPLGESVPVLHPDALVDAILAKRNLGTRITDAPVVIGVGPGFTVGVDCHAAVETMRGHDLGRALYRGSPIENTGVPGLIGGFAGERVLRAPADGVFVPLRQIGDRVREGDAVGSVNGVPMRCTIGGVLRGLLAEGIPVTRGMKAGDVDPRCEVSHCWRASDKALAVGGGVLEAILHLREEAPWKTK